MGHARLLIKATNVTSALAAVPLKVQELHCKDIPGSGDVIQAQVIEKKACTYSNFSYRVTCNGCRKPKSWIPETVEQKAERERKKAEEMEA